MLDNSISSSSNIHNNNNSGVTLPLASHRWNITKRRIEIDKNIQIVHEQLMDKIIRIDTQANNKASSIYNQIINKMKSFSPSLPKPYTKLVLEYNRFIITQGSLIPFPKIKEVELYDSKLVGGYYEKYSKLLLSLTNKVFNLIHKRDILVQSLQSQLLLLIEKLTIKKDNELNWMMRSNKSKIDEVFSIWYLAEHNKIRELDILLHSPNKYSEFNINQPDPDFGMTPLHYACKTVKVNMVLYLLEHGANVLMRAADGRTALHFAAQYSSRDIVIHLLGAGAEYDAVDNYGCTALQLAEQNKNKLTALALRRWVALLPNSEIEMELTLERDSFLSMNEQDYHNVPYEFRQTPADALDRMSPTLRLLTKRLDAYNIYIKHPLTENGSLARLAHSTGRKPYQSNAIVQQLNSSTLNITDSSFAHSGKFKLTLDSSNDIKGSIGSTPNDYHNDNNSSQDFPAGVTSEINDCLVEIRLLTKHYLTCVKENLEHEAMRSLQRRWAVALRLWGLVTENRERELERKRSQEEKWNMSDILDGKAVNKEGDVVTDDDSRLNSVSIDNLEQQKLEPTQSSIAHSKNDKQNIDGSDLREDADSASAVRSLDVNSHVNTEIDPSSIDGENAPSTHQKESIAINSPTKVTNDLEQLALKFEKKLKLAAQAAEAEEQAKIAAADRSFNPVATHTSLLNEDAWRQYGPVAEARLAREREYDAIGLDVYKVSDNIFYEKDNTDHVSEAPSGLLPSLTNTSMPNTTDATASRSDTASAEATEQNAESTEDKPKLTALEVILKWQAISKERAERQPYFDTYYAGVNDELISAGSSLTATYNIEGSHALSSSAQAAVDISQPPNSSHNSSDSLSSSLLSPMSQKFDQIDAPRNYKTEISGSYVAKLGMELCHVFVARQEEGLALPVLEECLRIHENIEDTLRIAILAQKCELLLQLHGLIISPDPPFSNRIKSIMYAILSEYPDERRAKIIDKVIDRWKHFLAQRRNKVRETTQQLYGNSVEGYVDDDTTDIAVSLSLPSAEVQSREINHDYMSYYGSTIESIDDNNYNKDIADENFSLSQTEGLPENDIELNKQFEEINNNVMQLQDITSSSKVADCGDIGDLDLDIEFATIDARKSVLEKAIIVQCLLASNESLAIHRHVFHSGRSANARIGDCINNIIEPPSVATVLLHKAKAAELIGRNKEALDCLYEAEAVAMRSLGPTCEFTINIMIEALRLYVKFKLPILLESGLLYVDQRVSEINRAITAFSLTADDNSSILSICDKLLKRSTDLLALATVSIHAQKEQSNKEAMKRANELKVLEAEEKRKQRLLERKNKNKLIKEQKKKQHLIEKARAKNALTLL